MNPAEPILCSLHEIPDPACFVCEERRWWDAGGIPDGPIFMSRLSDPDSWDTEPQVSDE